MKNVGKPEYQVIHPDKVIDIQSLIRLHWQKVPSNYYPVIVIMGAGTEEAYYNGYKMNREIHHMINYYNVKGIPLKNIIVIEHEESLCKEWEKLGISVFKYKWYWKMCLIHVRNYIRTLSEGIPHIFLYANHYGTKKNVKLHRMWLEIFKPHLFASLFSFRKAFTIEKINKEIDQYEKYNRVDLGFISKGNNGIIGYQGLAMAVVEKIGYKFKLRTKKEIRNGNNA